MSQDFRILDGSVPTASQTVCSPEISAAAALKDILFGSTAGILGKILEYPFDTVKVRLQSQPEDRPLRFRGPLDCFKQSIQRDGLRGLYRGISPPLVGAAAENSALFFSYNFAQDIARKFIYPDHPSENALPMGVLVACGGASGAFASFILTPIELVKCKMQVQSVLTGTGAEYPVAHTLHDGSPSKYAGPVKLLQQIYHAHGMRGFWHGQTGTFLREAGGSAAWFGAYEYISLSIRRWRDNTALAASDMMLAGAAAGVSYNFVLFPADSIKSRMQTQAIGIRGASTNGFWAVGQSMFRAGGIASLYRGCGLTCIRSAPSSAVIFLVYETLKSHFAC